MEGEEDMCCSMVLQTRGFFFFFYFLPPLKMVSHFMNELPDADGVPTRPSPRGINYIQKNHREIAGVPS